MKRPLLIVFIRHAESARNKAKNGATYFADEEARKTLRGVADYKVPITEDGHAQAEKTGRYLKERFGTPNYLYHSGYKRTIQTMDGILKAYSREEKKNIDIRMNLFLRERDPGYTYDMTEAEAEAAFPWLQEYWKTFGGFMSKPPGGQSLADKVQECHMFLNMLFRDRAGEKVFVVTHGGTINCFRFLLDHWDYDRMFDKTPEDSISNCGITVYEYDPEIGRLKLRDHNIVCWK